MIMTLLVLTYGFSFFIMNMLLLSMSLMMCGKYLCNERKYYCERRDNFQTNSFSKFIIEEGKAMLCAWDKDEDLVLVYL